MSAADKASLEEHVAQNPNDVESRTKLLGYYFIKGRQEADAKANRQRHIVWLIENVPESEVLRLPYGGLNKSSKPTPTIVPSKPGKRPFRIRQKT